MEGFFADCVRSFAEDHNNKVMDSKEKEGFSSVRGYPLMMNESMMSLLGRLVSVVLTVLILGMFGQWLWNNYVTKLLTIAKPAKNVMDIVGLYVAMRLING